MTSRRAYPLAAVVLTMISFILVKTGRDALFFDAPSSLRSLPLAFVWIGLASIPAAAGHLAAFERWGTRHTRVGLLAGAAALLAVWPLLPGTGQIVGILFVVVPVLFAAVFASVWLLAGDLLESEAKPSQIAAYAQIAAGSTLGGVLGGLLARLLAEWVGPGVLLALGGALLAPVAALAVVAHRAFPADDVAPSATCEAPSATAPPSPEPAEPSRSPFRGAVELIRSSPIVATLVGIGALASAAGLLIEFQFYAVVVREGAASSTFFAGFYTAVNAAALIVQLVITPALQRRTGVTGALLVMPMGLFLLGGAVALSATLASRAALRVGEAGLKSAVHRAAWEQAFLPLGKKRRAVAKTVVDGMTGRASEALVGITLFVWITIAGADAIHLMPVTVAICLALAGWIALTFSLRRFVDGTPGTGEFVPTPLDHSCPVTSAQGVGKRR